MMNTIKISSSPTNHAKKKRRHNYSSTGILESSEGTTTNGVTLYEEDVGLAGIKTKNRVDSFSMSKIKMSMKLTKEDVLRLRDRKSRFGEFKPQEVELKSKRRDPLGGGISGTKRELKVHESFKGTNTNLEKDFLRLTTYPRKEDVRPLPILIKSLALIKYKYIQDEDFEWVNNQLKSVRQDIVCQGIRNNFVLDVYETHARILLEHGDLNEFNQCQTMIRSLTEKIGNNNDTFDTSNSSCIDTCAAYPKNTSESCVDASSERNSLLQQSEESMLEFRSYAVLYALVRNTKVELQRELDRIKDFIRFSSNQDKVHTHDVFCCEHAFQVLQAVENSNYHKFFHLYESAPHMSAYLMDFLVKRVRDEAYLRIITAFRPTVSVEHIRESLYFDDLDETRRFLEQKNAIYLKVQGEEPFWIDCKSSTGK